MTSARARRSSVALVALVVVGLTQVPATAHAFCRTTTVAVDPSFQPGPTTCWDQGVPIYWENACVGYDIQRSTSKQVSYAVAQQALATAFGKWTSATCATDGTGNPRVSIDVRDLGPIDCAKARYDKRGPNQNVIIFRDDAWPHPGSVNALAITTVSFDPDTGKLVDADMEINTYNVQLTTSGPVPKDGYDFASIITHEAGHFLGLAHSADEAATMFARYTPGATTMQDLAQDDVNAICTVYRPDGKRAVLSGQVVDAPQCDPTPRRGLSMTCDDPPSTRCAVTTPGVSAGSRVGWLGLAAGFIGLTLCRRTLRARGSN